MRAPAMPPMSVEQYRAKLKQAQLASAIESRADLWLASVSARAAVAKALDVEDGTTADGVLELMQLAFIAGFSSGFTDCKRRILGEPTP